MYVRDTYMKRKKIGRKESLLREQFHLCFEIKSLLYVQLS